MENILVITENIFLKLYNESLKNYSETNSNLHIDVYCLDFPKKLNCIKKIQYKLDYNNFRKRYYDLEREKLIKLIKKYDTILFINLFFDKEYFIQGELKELLKTKNTKVYFADSVKNFDIPYDLMQIFKRIYVFEQQDVRYIYDKYGIIPELIFGGTSYYLFKDNINSSNKKIYDICFVGISTPKRLMYLDKIAEWCKNNNVTFFVAGHFWHTNNIVNYMIGKFKFKVKHPILANYVNNKFISPRNLAKIYSQSKIVLNINVVYHKSLNQRTFDVMYCKSLLICDEQDLSTAIIEPNRDFIMCKNVDSMIENINYYLNNEQKRSSIANNGNKIVKENYLFKSTLDKIFQRR